MIKKYFWFACAIFISCEMIVDMDVPFNGPALTLNSIFTNDSVLSAQLSLNRHILDDSTLSYVDDAIVTIGEEGKDGHELTSEGNGIYRSPIRPEAGKKYDVRVFSEKYGTVEGSSYIPVPAEIIKVEITESLINYQYETYLSVTFNDDPSSENFYEFIAFFEEEWLDYRDGSVALSGGTLMFESQDPVVQNENEDINFFEGVIFKDTFFNGKTHTANFSSSQSLSQIASYTIVLRSLSKDYYNYKFTTGLQKSTSNDPLAQPVNVYNNILNGFGIFGGYSQSASHHSHPKPVITSLSSYSGKAGDEIIIYGENLRSIDPNLLNVYFPAEMYYNLAHVLENTENEIKVRVPDTAVTGKISIRVNGRVALADRDFEVTN
jgi:hypothetical protein